jgi:cell division protein FtsL
MLDRRKLIFGAFAVALFGALAAVGVVPALPYILLTSVVSTLIGVGGMMHYTKQEISDLRDIYLEREKMLKEKIEVLQEEVINKEKENILLIEKNKLPKKGALDISINMPSQ